MGQQDTTEAKIAAKHVTKITGQPTDRDLTLLRKELVKIAGKEATSLGGGKHGHIGLLMKEADYKAISNGGVEFAIPSHPGHAPTTLSTVTGTREKQLLKHKAELMTYETCQGVISGIKELIAGAVSTEWLEEINDDILEFQNVSCLKMFEHLEARGGNVDYINIQEMRREPVDFAINSWRPGDICRRLHAHHQVPIKDERAEDTVLCLQVFLKQPHGHFQTAVVTLELFPPSLIGIHQSFVGGGVNHPRGGVSKSWQTKDTSHCCLGLVGASGKPNALKQEDTLVSLPHTPQGLSPIGSSRQCVAGRDPRAPANKIEIN